jgi:hypothetical protein
MQLSMKSVQLKQKSKAIPRTIGSQMAVVGLTRRPRFTSSKLFLVLISVKC